MNGYASAMAGQMIKGDVIMELCGYSSAGAELALVEVREAVQKYTGETSEAQGKKTKPSFKPRKASYFHEGRPSSSNGPPDSQSSLSAEPRTCVQETAVVASTYVPDGGQSLPVNDATLFAQSSADKGLGKQYRHRNPEQDHSNDSLNSYAALQNEYEPRACLLWTTIAKVTSVDFQRTESLPEPKLEVRPPEGEVSVR